MQDVSWELVKSPPTRGAWIEMYDPPPLTGGYYLSPPTRGAWIEIIYHGRKVSEILSRPPHGGRGLKFDEVRQNPGEMNVAPHTGGVD